MSDYTATHISGPLNSTEFTNCCGLAVSKPPYWQKDAEVQCPGCSKAVSFRPPPSYSPNCRMCGSPRIRCNC